jgi:hypothetical protein
MATIYRPLVGGKFLPLLLTFIAKNRPSATVAAVLMTQYCRATLTIINNDCDYHSALEAAMDLVVVAVNNELEEGRLEEEEASLPVITSNRECP